MSRISLVSLFPLLMVPSSTDSLLRDACSSHLSKDSNLMFFIFQHMLWVTVDDSCAFIGIYAQVPIKMQAPQGVPIASRTIAYLVFGTKYSNSGWLNDISVSMLNSSQAKGQREKKRSINKSPMQHNHYFIPWFLKSLSFTNCKPLFIYWQLTYNVPDQC